MQSRTVEQVESWESRPFSGGFGALHDLSDDDFTGAVVAAGTWLFMLNGRVVGVFEGSIDDFESDSGTVYEAPDDSLPLLFSMQERGGSTRAKYFTNDTPLREADQTLTDANFTGYVELSENVLSGDYYLVYYGGKQMSAAFIGQSERLLSGSEAYERAADEVGIYEVKDVSMNITEIPAPPEPEPEPTTGAVSTGDPDTREPAEDSDSVDAPAESETPQAEDDSAQAPGGRGEEPASDPPGTTAEDVGGQDPTPSEATGRTGVDTASDETESPAEADTSSGAEETQAPTGSGTADAPSYADRDEPRETESEAETGAEPDPAPAESGRESPSETVDAPEAEDSFVDSQDAGETSEKDELQRMFEEEEEWRQTRSIPSLHPEDTEDTGDEDEQPPKRRKQRSKPTQTTSTESSRTPQSGVSRERVEELREAIERREDQIEDLSSTMETVKSERSQMEGELEELRAERDDLEERVSNLESALQRAKDQQAAIDTTATEISPEEALSGTNLFVRYDSKGKPTLDALESGEVDPEAVNANLRLEHHTQFEAEDVVVGTQEFDAFLEGTSSYRFVSWVVRELPYELLQSGKRSDLGDLYEAIPGIDRIEFEGEITVSKPDGETVSSTFGVVMRDRMGNPLIVADLNDERDPVRGEEMAELIESSTAVGDAQESLAGAFYVTASFFEPAALEEAEGAASTGGLFSRTDKASYVKTANKSGFHLCLVEDRAESFHVTVPEL